ncbi:Clp1/GlmU family protein [Desulfuromonas sp. TF]|uniref:Clp1/GlmU family protein n=1 Tax=Desulfuromonas sp. TF TaxID=1232410 RepID=UPI000410AD0D|nr:Clp1/GlmU family protein [Desulfuromonas sp. TF]
MTDDRICIPTAWETLEPERLTGTILVIGASDRGKSTLVRWLVEKLLRRQPKVGWLDGDIGQSTLGVPSTMNLAVLKQFDPNPPQRQGTFFVGSTSPRGHMLPTLVGVELLNELALKKGAAAVVIDTTGLVAEDAGGGALKQWKIELLRPDTVIALQRDGELEHLLAPMRRERRFTLHEIPVAQGVVARSAEERAGRRRLLFRRYFEKSQTMQIDPAHIPVYGGETCRPGRLAAFHDGRGLTLALGTIAATKTGGLEILTPLDDLSEVAGLRLGSILLDPATGNEFQ